MPGLDAETQKWTPVGLAIESNVAASTIRGKVKVSFDVTTSTPLVVCIMLVEDGIVFPQTNFYNNLPGTPFFNLGNPITNYIHNHTLRKFSTDIFGDPVPTASQVRDAVYEKLFSFDASAFNTAKCSIVAFAGFAKGLPFRSGILNLQTVKAGMNKAFD